MDNIHPPQITFAQALADAQSRTLNGARAFALANPIMRRANPHGSYANLTARSWFQMLDFYCPNGEAL